MLEGKDIEVEVTVANGRAQTRSALLDYTARPRELDNVSWNDYIRWYDKRKNKKQKTSSAPTNSGDDSDASSHSSDNEDVNIGGNLQSGSVKLQYLTDHPDHLTHAVSSDVTPLYPAFSARVLQTDVRSRKSMAPKRNTSA